MADTPRIAGQVSGIPLSSRGDESPARVRELAHEFEAMFLAQMLRQMRESMAIVRQILEAMPPGDYRIQDRKVTLPPRGRIDESMEALIHHFKIFTEGFKVPEGEVYRAIESPRGELGCYMVSDGSGKPYRMHIRGPSFVNLQSMPHMLRGGLIADAVAVISSVDPIMGEVDR